MCGVMLGRSDYCLVPSGYCSGLLEAETGRVRSSDEIWAQNGGDPYTVLRRWTMGMSFTVGV